VSRKSEARAGSRFGVQGSRFPVDKNATLNPER
jgi:hypothetical protein